MDKMIRKRTLLTLNSHKLCCLTLLFNFSSSSLLMAQTATNDSLKVTEWYHWPVVGKAQLSWFIFDIYSSRLKAPDGYYVVESDLTPHPLALEVDYQRDVSAEQLLEATDEQWRKLGITNEQRMAGIERLKHMFPDIQKSDRLTYVTDGFHGALYYSNAARVELLGRVEQEWLNDAFLAIWLSPDTTYPDLRQSLIGK